MTLPSTISIDAWTGVAAATGELDAAAADWGAGGGVPDPQDTLEFDAPADPTDWQHPNVGYGVLLPDGADVPAPIRRLLDAYPGTVVLRWKPQLGDRQLRRYLADGSPQDLLIGRTTFGTAERNRLPRYVLIAATPGTIPWSVQYALGVRHAVGRLPFDGDEIGPYIDAMLTRWADSTVDVTAPLLWTVDHGPTDITHLMRAALTAPLERALTGTLAGLQVVVGKRATGANLCDELARGPALVVTSSHGATPLDDRLGATLGLPVDCTQSPVSLDDLDAAMPSGAVWFAQACCSAGGAGRSFYDGLLPTGTSARAVVDTVASLGPTVSPAAHRLLSRPHPVRAVLGHVEPTFDWTLREKTTGQLLGNQLVEALSSNIHHGQPLGYAFDAYRESVGNLNNDWWSAHTTLADGDESVLELMTRLRLTAIDRQSLVLLGDPTVVLPPLP